MNNKGDFNNKEASIGIKDGELSEQLLGHDYHVDTPMRAYDGIQTVRERDTITPTMVLQS